MAKQNIAESLSLIVGEKVQISVDESNMAHPTLLEDIMEDGRLIISGPLYRGYPLPLHAGDGIRLYFYRENGRYRINCQVDKIFSHEELRLISLIVLSEPEKQQRRESFRLPVSLGAFIRMFDEELMHAKAARASKNEQSWETAMTHNLSETGVSINSRHEYQIGDCVHLRLQLEDESTGGQVELLGVVRQAEQVEISQNIHYRLGIEFLPYEENLRRRVVKFILKKQQAILQMKRNFES